MTPWSLDDEHDYLAILERVATARETAAHVPDCDLARLLTLSPRLVAENIRLRMRAINAEREIGQNLLPLPS